MGISYIIRVINPSYIVLYNHFVRAKKRGLKRCKETPSECSKKGRKCYTLIVRREPGGTEPIVSAVIDIIAVSFPLVLSMPVSL